MRVALYTNLASIYAARGRLAQAQQCAQQALMLDPRSTKAGLVLACVELRQGNSAAAVALLKQRSGHC